MPPPPDAGALPLGHAVALGLLHGPAELLPVSSSGHVALVPWLAGWPYAELDPELRKAFEVALHAGTAAALLIALRSEVAEAAAGLDRRRMALTVLSVVPPAVAARFLEQRIEREASSPGAIALGLLAGSAAMALVEWRSSRGRSRTAGHDRLENGARRTHRARSDAGAVDGLALGLAQACALWPGVSRNGATLVAARLRGFARDDANVLSRHVALPVIAGATALKGYRLARRGLPPRMAAAFAAGTAASFASTLASARIVRTVDRGHSLLPYAAYRTALAGLVVRRLRQNRPR
ncbi:MAG: undecaprenyl-diphosphatase [Solirubrobacteraceae bacterium]|jgi:undecaprenyl-diphosphatase|nr:undecaprenyl-diphosphatase [Solirubrobacteraceae bacterium]